MNYRDTLIQTLAQIEADMAVIRESGRGWTAIDRLHATRLKIVRELGEMPDPEETRESTLEEEIADAVLYAETMDDRVMAAMERIFKRRKKRAEHIVVPDRDPGTPS